MTVYVDDARIPFGRMLMCHMIADTRRELDAMADRIGVARKWRQHNSTAGEHYDVCWSKRQLAVQFGARPITPVALATICRNRRLDGERARRQYFRRSNNMPINEHSGDYSHIWEGRGRNARQANH